MAPKRGFIRRNAGLREVGESSRRTGEIELVHTCMSIDAKEVARSLERAESRIEEKAPLEGVTIRLECDEELAGDLYPREPLAGAGRAMNLPRPQRFEREMRAEIEDGTYFMRNNLKLTIVRALSGQSVYDPTRRYALETFGSMETARLEAFAEAMQLQGPANYRIENDPTVLRNAVVRALMERRQLLDPNGEGRNAMARIQRIIRRTMQAFAVEVREGDMDVSEGVLPAAAELSVLVVDCCKAQGLKIETITAVVETMLEELESEFYC